MDQPLEQQHCVPCEGGVQPLVKEKAMQLIAKITGWDIAPDFKSISKEFLFKNFKESMAFINKVADLAESEGHHPDIHCFWNKVKLELSTHAIGGLSDNDFILAAKINKL